VSSFCSTSAGPIRAHVRPPSGLLVLLTWVAAGTGIAQVPAAAAAAEAKRMTLTSPRDLWFPPAAAKQPEPCDIPGSMRVVDETRRKDGNGEFK
jgi:hypothetical protein